MKHKGKKSSYSRHNQVGFEDILKTIFQQTRSIRSVLTRLGVVTQWTLKVAKPRCKSKGNRSDDEEDMMMAVAMILRMEGQCHSDVSLVRVIRSLRAFELDFDI